VTLIPPDQGENAEASGYGGNGEIAVIVPAEPPDLNPEAAIEFLALLLEVHQNLLAERHAKHIEAS
jgi:hypothetical protein